MIGKLEDAQLILSEFCGCNTAFSGYIEFNPFNMLEFMQKLDYGLSMSKEEKLEQAKMAYSYVHKTPNIKWVEMFLKDLKIAYKPTTVSYYLGLSVGLDFRIIHTKSEMRKLDIGVCASQFYNCNKCLIFIDHEAFPAIDFAKDEMIPQQQSLDDINEILVDNRNTVVLYSNQSRDELEEKF